jgi:hypothetical protein
MSYKVLLQRLLANINKRRLAGAFLGFFVFTVGTATDNISLVIVGLATSIIEIWDLYENQD